MEQLKLQPLTEQPATEQVTEREKKTRGILSRQLLRRENRMYAGTTGVSQNNGKLGFIPGYFDTQTGETIISRFADGRPCPVHTLEGLPLSWVALRDHSGRVLTAREGVVAGFLLDGCFFTREQAAAMIRH